jgi:hypothetical protein
MGEYFGGDGWVVKEYRHSSGHAQCCYAKDTHFLSMDIGFVLFYHVMSCHWDGRELAWSKKGTVFRIQPCNRHIHPDINIDWSLAPKIRSQLPKGRKAENEKASWETCCRCAVKK